MSTMPPDLEASSLPRHGNATSHGELDSDGIAPLSHQQPNTPPPNLKEGIPELEQILPNQVEKPSFQAPLRSMASRAKELVSGQKMAFAVGGVALLGTLSIIAFKHHKGHDAEPHKAAVR